MPNPMIVIVSVISALIGPNDSSSLPNFAQTGETKNDHGPLLAEKSPINAITESESCMISIKLSFTDVLNPATPTSPSIPTAHK